MNVGIVAFLNEGARVYVDPIGTRLRALHPDFDRIDFADWAAELEEVLPDVGDKSAQLQWLKGGLGAISADENFGNIHVETLDELPNTIEDLLSRFVRIPERTVTLQTKKAQPSRSKLHVQLRSWFRFSKVFSSNVADLSNGRIVASYPIDVADDLYADFALKNGAVHIMEALDLRGVERITKSVRGEAGFAAVLLDQARHSLSLESKRIAVTAADDYAIVKPVVHLVSRYADDVFAMESTADRQRLSDFISGSLQLNQPLRPLALD